MKEVSCKSKRWEQNSRGVENTTKKGTWQDIIAAMSMTVENNPIHKLYALDGLSGHIQVGSIIPI
jgi:hypothetical protein